jgi:carboxyl-terminal processing protease
LLVLVDQGSASGAEILAAALRDNRGVKLLGEKTFGKGSVQQIEQLKGGSSLKVTVATWLSPKGELINDKGLQPDIEIKMTDDDYEADRDPQLLKALEIMKEM